MRAPKLQRRMEFLLQAAFESHDAPPSTLRASGRSRPRKRLRRNDASDQTFVASDTLASPTSRLSLRTSNRSAESSSELESSSAGSHSARQLYPERTRISASYTPIIPGYEQDVLAAHTLQTHLAGLARGQGLNPEIVASAMQHRIQSLKERFSYTRRYLSAVDTTTFTLAALAVHRLTPQVFDRAWHGTLMNHALTMYSQHIQAFAQPHDARLAKILTSVLLREAIRNPLSLPVHFEARFFSAFERLALQTPIPQHIARDLHSYCAHRNGRLHPNGLAAMEALRRLPTPSPPLANVSASRAVPGQAAEQISQPRGFLATAQSVPYNRVPSAQFMQFNTDVGQRNARLIASEPQSKTSWAARPLPRSQSARIDRLAATLTNPHHPATQTLMNDALSTLEQSTFTAAASRDVLNIVLLETFARTARGRDDRIAANTFATLAKPFALPSERQRLLRLTHALFANKKLPMPTVAQSDALLAANSSLTSDAVRSSAARLEAATLLGDLTLRRAPLRRSPSLETFMNSAMSLRDTPAAGAGAGAGAVNIEAAMRKYLGAILEPHLARERSIRRPSQGKSGVIR